MPTVGVPETVVQPARLAKSSGPPPGGLVHGAPIPLTTTLSDPDQLGTRVQPQAEPQGAAAAGVYAHVAIEQMDGVVVLPCVEIHIEHCRERRAVQAGVPADLLQVVGVGLSDVEVDTYSGQTGDVQGELRRPSLMSSPPVLRWIRRPFLRPARPQ